MTTVILLIIDSDSQFRKKKSIVFTDYDAQNVLTATTQHELMPKEADPRMFNFLLFNYVNHLITF